MDHSWCLLRRITFCVAVFLTAGTWGNAQAPAPSQPELILQSGHTKFVQALAWAPRGEWLVSASFDGLIKIWDTSTGQELRSLSGHAGPVRSVAVSPNSEVIASAGTDGSVRLWNAASGEQMAKADLNASDLKKISFLSDGSGLAVIAGGAGPLLLDARSLAEKMRVTEPPLGAAVDLSNDARSLISAASDGTLSLTDVATGKAVWKKKTGLNITDIAFLSGPDAVAVSSADGSVLVLRAAKGDRIASAAAMGRRILSLTEGDAGSVLITYENGHVAKLELSAAASLQTVYRNGEEGVLRSAAISPSRTLAALGNGDGAISLVDLTSGKITKQLASYTNGIYGVAVSRDRRWLAGAGFDNSIKLWDLGTGDAVGSLTGHTGRVRDVEFFPNSDSIVSASSDGTLRIWNAVTRRMTSMLAGHTASVSTVDVGPFGKMIVSGSLDRRVGVWDGDGKKPPMFISGHQGEVTGVALSADAALVASVSTDGSLRLWDTVSGSPRGAVDAAAGELSAVRFSPDSTLIAAAGIDGKIRIYSTTGLQLLRALSGHSGRINDIQFSRDGGIVMSAGQDRSIGLWNTGDGTAIAVMSGHSGAVFSLDVSPSGDWLFSCSDDGTISLWSTAARSRAVTLTTLKGTGDWLAVTPRGFFDGSPAAWKNLSWRFGGKTFDVKPVEVFFNEFYVPGLVADILNEKPLPSADITQRDRRQPVVEIVSVSEKPDGLASVKLKISSAPAGAKDLRLFRNGSLVKAWRGDVLGGRGEAVVDAEVRYAAGVNRFTSYAFNRDDVKSGDAAATLTVDRQVTAAPADHILAIGIDRYANADYDLSQAVNDATGFSGELDRRRRLSGGQAIKATTLLDRNATKENILKALSGLASAAGPNDTVTIFFAGHGIAVDEKFYLIPHDLGFTAPRNSQTGADLSRILSHSISDDELDRAIESIDARNILLIIDSCNSGQILDTAEKRRGPMNSKGLAQLAYEKGMYILTASQSFQAAKEDARLGHGYLTYALIEEGLKAGAADRSPKDGDIDIREWLNYATDRVPEIDEEEIGKVEKRSRKIEREKGKALAVGSGGDVQRPRVFYRREQDAEPFIVARTEK